MPDSNCIAGPEYSALLLLNCNDASRACEMLEVNREHARENEKETRIFEILY